MKERDLFELVKSKLENYEEAPDSSSWDFIEKSLAARRRRVIFYRSISVITASAAVIALFLIVGKETLWNSFTQEPALEVVVQDVTPEKFEKTKKLEKPKELGKIEKFEKRVLAMRENILEESDRAKEEQPLEVEKKPEAKKSETKSPDTKLSDTKLPEAKSPDSKPRESTKRGEFHYVSGYRGERPKIAASLMFSPSSGGSERFLNTSMGVATSELSSSMQREEYQLEASHDTRYLPPVSVGVQLSVPINRIFSVTTGVNYTMLYSTIETKSASFSMANSKVEQTLHYMGVPLYLIANIYSNDKFYLYGGAGLTMEKGLAEQIKQRDLIANDISISRDIKGLQWSAGVTLGAEYLLSKSIGLYADPMLTYYFKNNKYNQPRSIRTAQPLQFRLEIGLRYRF